MSNDTAQARKFNAIIALERTFRPGPSVKAEIALAYETMDFDEFKEFHAFRVAKGGVVY